MKLKVLLAISAVCVLTTVARADQASHEQAAKDLMHTMDMKNTIETSFQQMVDSQIKVQPQLAPFRQTMLDFFTKYMNWESLEPDFVRLYSAKFSEDDLKDLGKFYSTPLGQKVLKTMPEVMMESTAIGQQRVQAHIGELQQMIMAESQRMQQQMGSPTTAPAGAPDGAPGVAPGAAPAPEAAPAPAPAPAATPAP
jgi:uncharacterized protein